MAWDDMERGGEVTQFEVETVIGAFAPNGKKALPIITISAIR